MNTTAEFAIVLRPTTADTNDTNNHTLVRRDTSALTVGAGYTVAEAFRGMGRRINNAVVNVTGGSPQHCHSAIENFFGKDVESRLDELQGAQRFDSDPHKQLWHACRKLLEYARPQSERAMTQHQVFIYILLLTTRYPGIRRVFHTLKDIQTASKTSPPFSKLWVRESQIGDEKWQLDRDLAICCISESSLSNLVEGEKASNLCVLPGDSPNWNLVPIERLLPYCELDLPSYSKLDSASENPHRDYRVTICAIRYLGGILEFPTFWRSASMSQKQPQFHALLGRICKLLTNLFNDTVDLSPPKKTQKIPLWVLYACSAADSVASTILGGVERAREAGHVSLTGLALETRQMIRLLLEGGQKDRFPKASQVASSFYKFRTDSDDVEGTGSQTQTFDWVDAHKGIDTSKRYYIRNRATGRVWSFIDTTAGSGRGFVMSGRPLEREPYFQWTLINAEDQSIIIETPHGNRGIKVTEDFRAGPDAPGYTPGRFHFIPVLSHKGWYFIGVGVTNGPPLVVIDSEELLYQAGTTAPIAIENSYHMWELIDVNAL